MKFFNTLIGTKLFCSTHLHDYSQFWKKINLMTKLSCKMTAWLPKRETNFISLSWARKIQEKSLCYKSLLLNTGTVFANLGLYCFTPEQINWGLQCCFHGNMEMTSCSHNLTALFNSRKAIKNIINTEHNHLFCAKFSY